MVSTQNFENSLEALSARVNAALEQWLPVNQPEVSCRLNEAVRYSALAGGKRIRPALCVMVCEGFGLHNDASLRAGCAFELIHTYSLIHDDLPAMDNDDYRRGKPTNHKVFGEATAILAGDSLLTLAFEWFATLADYGVSADKIIKIIKIASLAAGHQGMIGGQMLDIAYEKQGAGLQILESIHRQKTGALIIAPAKTGAILADASPEDLQIIEAFSARIGLLFQIVDDILDVEGDLDSLGKMPGRDVVMGKSTYPSLLGLDGARNYADQIFHAAINGLNGLSRPQPLLADMASFILNRKK
ncbi:MAG: polyprenyl synthetase family protein [Erysipelotrichia bacterium]|nr:polyprenyl synthetase family protein [Erysipelotrichia bacterium]